MDYDKIRNPKSFPSWILGRIGNISVTQRS
jgi:hypothetical protein